MGIGATAGVAAAGGMALNAEAAGGSSASPSDALVFDPDAYTELTTTVTDTAGAEHSVTYHFWKAITYVADPVDAKYQSLNVSVPVEIDGTAMDASDAPILFANSVGGYMPSSPTPATSSPGSPGSRVTAPGSGSTQRHRQR